MFYLTGVGLAFFLCLLLVTKRNKSTADILLATWLLLNTLHLLFFYLDRTRQYPQFLGAAMPLPLVHGPFLYAYTRALTNRALPTKVLMLHFLPALVVLVWMIPFLLLTTAEKQVVFDNRGVGYETFNTIRYSAVVLSGILYVILSSLVLQRHRRSIAEEFSYTEKINLAWLQYLIYWIGAIWLGVLLSNETMIFSTAVLFMVFVGYFGIRQTSIFHVGIAQTGSVPGTERAEAEPHVTAEKRKYEKSGLTVEASQSLHLSLINLMESEKVFRESELSLTELAARLNTPPNYLSQVINEREGKTFYDYINTLRIEEFKRLAAGPDSRRYTLLGLAQECGFNSKSSFNRYFKKVTGTSPSQFVPELH